MTTLLVLAIAGFVGWRISLKLWPYAPCRKCSGNGKNDGSNRRRWGYCRRCERSARRERVGLRWFSTGQDR